MSDSSQSVLKEISHPEDEELSRSLLDLIEISTVDLELAA